MTIHPNSPIGIKQSNLSKRRLHLTWAGVGAIMLAALIFGLWPAAEQTTIDGSTSAPKTGKLQKQIKMQPDTEKNPPMEMTSGVVESVAPLEESNLDSAPEKDVSAEILPDAQAELESALLQNFRAEAMETLPLLTIHTADPLKPDKPGPKRGDVWVRINAGNSKETRDIMAQVADLYRTALKYDDPVTVMLWVGGQPMARFEY